MYECNTTYRTYQKASQQFDIFLRKKSSGRFYTGGYNLIVLDSSSIFPVLTPKVATSLSSKFLDVYLAWNNEKKEVYRSLKYIADYFL